MYEKWKCVINYFVSPDIMHTSVSIYNVNLYAEAKVLKNSLTPNWKQASGIGNKASRLERQLWFSMLHNDH